MVQEAKGSLKVYKDAKELFWHNLLGGIGWGLGSVLGATIIVGILGLLLNWLGGLPVIGRWLGEWSEAIRQGIRSVTP